MTSYEHYTSTACQHDEHIMCRLVCKFCNEMCKCRCHYVTNTDTTPLSNENVSDEI